MFYHKVSLNCSQSHSSEQPMLATTLQIQNLAGLNIICIYLNYRFNTIKWSCTAKL